MRTKLALLFVLIAAYGTEVLADKAPKSDVVVYLRTSDHGPWGAVLRAGKKASVSRSRLANIMPLVVADNELWDATRLPVGKRIVIKRKYLQSGFRPNKETIRLAHEIFPPDVPAANSVPTKDSPCPDERILIVPQTADTYTDLTRPTVSSTSNPPSGNGNAVFRLIFVAVVYCAAGFMLCMLMFWRRIGGQLAPEIKSVQNN